MEGAKTMPREKRDICVTGRSLTLGLSQLTPASATSAPTTISRILMALFLKPALDLRRLLMTTR